MKKIFVTMIAALMFVSSVSADTFLCDANIRDANGDIIGSGCAGDYVEVTGYDECTGRVIVYDYTTGTCGTVVSGSLQGEYYYEPESYYDDYDCYNEPTDVYYDDGYVNYEYVYNDYVDYYDCTDNNIYVDNNYVDEYETYDDCSENYLYTPEYPGEVYVDDYTDNSCSENYVDNYEDYVYEYAEENYVDEYTEDNDCVYTEYGNTWIDIDLSCQTISVYSDENKVLASVCVTGMAGIMDTPTGVWSILDKQRNATLVGDDYECPVDFWMPFTGSGCGIHDASWRSDFSSDAYLYNGSHGCVNVGYDTASSIYNLVDCGTSVVVHY